MIWPLLARLRLADVMRRIAMALRPPVKAPPPYIGLDGDAGGPFATVWDETAYDRARHLLDRVTRVANALDTPLYLYWGSLLGHVREGRILAWDDDIDLALFDPSKLEALQFALMKEGLRVHEHLGEAEFWVKIFDPHYPRTSEFAWTHPFVDIFVYTLDDARNGHEWAVRTMRRAMILPGRKISFEGATCFEPQYPMAVLDEEYPGWRTTELSPAWNHRDERANGTQAERAIRLDWRGRKRGGASKDYTNKR